MVHVELGQTNAGILQIAGDLADRFHARLVGIAAEQPTMAVYNEGYMSGLQVEEDLTRIKNEISIVEAEFHDSLRGRNRAVEWRSRILYGPLAEYVAREARCADLILTGATSGGMYAGTRRVDAGELVLESGRPILVVPQAAGSLSLQQIVVCWKDTREARRAILDALPILKQATNVDVVEVCLEEDLVASTARLNDVVTWLRLHDVSAVALPVQSRGNEREELETILEDRKANLVIAGAYGHARLREWILGGVSRDLLIAPERCSLLSH
jgi:nucleotide-binding universal stress UspA family protein